MIFFTTILFIYGLHATTRSNMIFDLTPLVDRLSKKINPKVLIYVLKPTFDCTPCMASIYGTLSYFTFIYKTLTNF